ncbi:hypothetical protein LPJ53_002141 [Coemansia erecta]|uniref:DUF4246 domain-containing protein n=1 Tax=Coemansia erecta TaxID=147472 RepID=A0A9W7Y3Y3_9FUNG|nr:hypothetical protein LPJ53_002141 [Coemansia erecta]
MPQDSEKTLEARYDELDCFSSFFISAIRWVDTKYDRRIRRMSGYLRTKQNWIDGLNNPDVRECWKSEAKEYDLTDFEIAYIFDELAYYAIEFIVAKDGTVTIKSYINNLHPVKHAEFYPTIATIFGRFVPLFENVITDILYTRKQRVKPNWPSKWITSEPEPKDVGADDCKESYIKWRNSMRRVEPQPKPFVTPERPTTPFSLRGRRLQAVVKMASIELTPKNPKYGGEDWHVEALANERIVATGIYYYDAENITECSLSFREMVSLIDDREKIGRADPAKPGHQKMLVIHLIDPVNPTVLTEIVPPQQQSWWREVVLNTTQIGELPHVVTDILFRHVDFPIPPKDAKKTRLRLISARINANIEYIRSYFEAGAFNSDIPWDYIW